MGTGGTRVRSGRPPDALNSAGSDWIALPAEGRPGRTPQWPLTKATTRERTIWRRLWKLPQAIEWERTHQELTVATYTRTLARAEALDAPAGLIGLAKQQADNLGLTTPGMRANRWRIAPVDTRPARVTTRRTSRDRLRVVGDDLLELADVDSGAVGE